MSAKPKTGDVFLVPLDDQRYGIGQVAGNWKGELYVVIYDKIVSGDATPAELTSAGFQFAALTLDAKFHHGDWPIVGNLQDNLSLIPQPWFKVGQGGQAYVESRDRSVTRPATGAEETQLRLRTVVAPVRLENALKALHGIGDWHDRFDELRADYALESSRLIGD